MSCYWMSMYLKNPVLFPLSLVFNKLQIFKVTQVMDGHSQSSVSLIFSANNWKLLKQKQNFLLAACVNEGLKHT